VKSEICGLVERNWRGWKRKNARELFQLPGGMVTQIMRVYGTL
jgi:hypothetical protein